MRSKPSCRPPAMLTKRQPGPKWKGLRRKNATQVKVPGGYWVD